MTRPSSSLHDTRRVATLGLLGPSFTFPLPVRRIDALLTDEPADADVVVLDEDDAPMIDPPCAVVDFVDKPVIPVSK